MVKGRKVYEGMIRGKQVYDPISDIWSTGYWIPVYNCDGQVKDYVPIWTESKKRKEEK